MSERAVRFVICLSNAGFPASLEVRKVYVAISDEEAEAKGLLRVIDESEEDYLYPAAQFAELELPPAVAQALSQDE